MHPLFLLFILTARYFLRPEDDDWLFLLLLFELELALLLLLLLGEEAGLAVVVLVALLELTLLEGLLDVDTLL